MVQVSLHGWYGRRCAMKCCATQSMLWLKKMYLLSMILDVWSFSPPPSPYTSPSHHVHHSTIGIWVDHNVIIIRQPSYHPVNHPSIRGERCFEVDWVNSRLVTLLPEEARACETGFETTVKRGGHVPDIRSTCCDMFLFFDVFWRGRRSSSFERNGMVLDMCVQFKAFEVW